MGKPNNANTHDTLAVAVAKDGASAAGAAASDSKIVKESRVKTIEDYQLNILRKIIYRIYIVDREIPTLRKLFVASKEEFGYSGSKKLLRKILKCKLGYQFRICKNNGPLPMERLKLTCNRAKYLGEIKKNDDLGLNRRPILYLDELEIELNDLCQINEKVGLSEKCMLLCAAGMYGFIDGIKITSINTSPLHEDDIKLNKNKIRKFMKWIHVIIPKLPPNSIVVLDNAPAHNLTKEIIPSEMLSTKSDMRKWLAKHNVNFNDSMHRVELLQLIKKNKPHKNYVADELLKKAGHTVLRLPIYCDLNPLEKIFRLIEKRVIEKYSRESELSDVIVEAMKSITPEDFAVEFDRIKQMEIQYLENEHLMDDVTDNLNLSFDSYEEFFSTSGDYSTDFSSSQEDDGSISSFGSEESNESDYVDISD